VFPVEHVTVNTGGQAIQYECRLEPPNCRTFRLRYKTDDEYNDEVANIDETIYLRRFPQPYGGYRWYFICPSSNRRCLAALTPCGRATGG
jgi:hypothetical protein